MSTESFGFTDKGKRDDLASQLKKDGEKGVVKYSTHKPTEHINPDTGEVTMKYPMLYVVAYSAKLPQTIAKEHQ
jgi:hypothetical protein